MLVAASRVSMLSPKLGPDADPDRLAGRVAQAHCALVVLVVLVGPTSVAVGIGLIVLTREFDPVAVAVAAVAMLVLFLRTSAFELASEAMAPVIAAGAGLFGLLSMLASSDVAKAYLVPAFLVVGVLAIAVGLPVPLWGTGRSSRGDRPTQLGPLFTIAQIVLPALLLGVYGLYSMLWNLGR